ncbi:MAG: gene transfer agent family protein [Oscillospiraceae bacterium]|nr:gene transfer agent family protein [Oscillospiraceae bacterium]
MENIRVRLGEREIPLKFTMEEFAEIEEAVGNLSLIDEILLKGKQRIRNLATAIRIMGNAGLAGAGEKPDLTDKTVMNLMKPRKLVEYQTAAISAINQGMLVESNEDEVHDIVLEDIERKKETGN